MNTKERIIDESLKLFARKGFHAVSVREIAKAVGIKDSSLYNHFAGKREIFDSIVEVCCREEEQYFLSRQIPAGPEEDMSSYRSLSYEQLEDKILCTFSYFWENTRSVQFRQLLMISQYEFANAAEVYRKIFVEYPMKIQSAVFSDMIQAGVFQKGDPDSMAMEFYGPVFLMIHTCQSFQEAKPLLIRHLYSFVTHHRQEGL